MHLTPSARSPEQAYVPRVLEHADGVQSRAVGTRGASDTLITTRLAIRSTIGVVLAKGIFAGPRTSAAAERRDKGVI